MKDFDKLMNNWKKMLIINEWKKEDEEDYPSRKKRKKDKMMMKPNKNASSWNHGYDELEQLAKGLIEDAKAEELILDNLNAEDVRYLRGIISTELSTALKKHMSSSGCSFQQLVTALRIWAKAEKGND